MIVKCNTSIALAPRGAKAILYFALAFLILATASCKPTEKNYQAAYDRAFEAAQRRAQAQESSATGATLNSMEGIRTEVVGSDTLLVGGNSVRPFETTIRPDGNSIGIAVANYKVPTNARRHLADLKKEYPDALIATDGEDNYYVMVKRVASLPDAADALRVFDLAHPSYSYLGLSGRPLLLYIR